jgi:hypothetical protein
MSFQPSPLLLSVLAGLLTSGLMLTVASCSHVAPLGPAADIPQPHHLRSPIVMQVMNVKPLTPPTSAGGCPAGFTKLSAPGQGPECYRPLGAPVTFTSAAVAPGPTQAPASPSNASPSTYGLLIGLPAAERPELTAITTQAYNSRGAVDISVAGETWGLPLGLAPLTHGQFVIALPSRNDLLQLQRLLSLRTDGHVG